MAKRIVSIPHKFRLAGAISFRKDYSPPSCPPSRPYTRAPPLHLVPSILLDLELLVFSLSGRQSSAAAGSPARHNSSSSSLVLLCHVHLRLGPLSRNPNPSLLRNQISPADLVLRACTSSTSSATLVLRTCRFVHPPPLSCSFFLFFVDFFLIVLDFFPQCH